MQPVYTIGHSNLSLLRFLEALQGNSIDSVVDIRSVPYSRFHPQYNQKSLKNALSDVHIGYIFEGESLGGRISDPECYVSGQIPEQKTGIAEYVDLAVLRSRTWFREGIDRITTLSEKQRIALLCSEEDPDRCHRKILVGAELERLGIEVVHIRTRKNLQDELPF